MTRRRAVRRSDAFRVIRHQDHRLGWDGRSQDARIIRSTERTTRPATDLKGTRLNAIIPTRRLFVSILAALSTVALAACNPGGPTPTPTPVGGVAEPADLAGLPQPRLATLELGSTGPGFDGPGSFYSYDSNQSPEATMGAYASQLLRAGYRESGHAGTWTVFVGPRLTVWVRVGSGGPPTSLLVRFAPTSEAADVPAPRPMTGATTVAAAVGTAAGPVAPKATSRPVVLRRPDPPHAASTTIASQPVSGGTAGTGTATGGITGGGTLSGGTTTGGTTSGGSSDGTTSGGGSGDDGRRP